MLVGETIQSVDGVQIHALVLHDFLLPHSTACLLLQGMSFKDAVRSVWVKDYGVFIPILIDGFVPYRPPPRIRRMLIGSIPEQQVQLVHAIEVFMRDPLWS